MENTYIFSHKSDGNKSILIKIYIITKIGVQITTVSKEILVENIRKINRETPVYDRKREVPRYPFTSESIGFAEHLAGYIEEHGVDELNPESLDSLIEKVIEEYAIKEEKEKYEYQAWDIVKASTEPQFIEEYRKYNFNKLPKLTSSPA